VGKEFRQPSVVISTGVAVMGGTLSSPDYAILHREADRASARLVRRYGLPRVDRDDVRQDLLVALLGRLRDFDPARGSLIAFATVVIRHRVARMIDRLKRERALFAPVSLDDPIGPDSEITFGATLPEVRGYLGTTWQGADQISILEGRLALERGIEHLSPTQRQLCVDLLEGPASVASAADNPSRSARYRCVREIRNCLLAAGIGWPP
jgi:DNA-directed RNA polymerase specialized sigma24 family protein